MTLVPATVLVVEDNDEMRAFLRRQLVDHYRVIEAASGDEAWTRLREERPDLLLSDAEMPGTDGWTLGRRVKVSTDLPSIPVILLEGDPTEPQEAEGETAQDRSKTEQWATEENGTGGNSSERVAVAGGDAVQRERAAASSATPSADAVLKKPFALDELQSELERYLPTRELPRYADSAGEFLKDVIRTIERRLHDPDFTAGALANAISLSRRHLTRQLKEAVGTTPAALIRERRIERAKAHFEAGDTKVRDVCTTVGFRSASHFSQSFREYEGCSPTTYIERNAPS